MSSRREERAKALAAKKAKLAELRAKRAARRKQPEAAGATSGVSGGRARGNGASSDRASGAGTLDDVHALVDSLLSNPPAGSGSAATTPEPSGAASPPTPTYSAGTDDGASSRSPSAAGEMAASRDAAHTQAKAQASRYASLTLTSPISIVHIPSKRRDRYEKSTQTEPVAFESSETKSSPSERSSPAGSPRTRGRRRSKAAGAMQESSTSSKDEVTATKTGSGNLVVTTSVDKESHTVADGFDYLESARRVLDEQERSDIESSVPFNAFLSSASSVIERALGHAAIFDPNTMYGSGTGEDDTGLDNLESRVVKTHTFFDSNLTGRAVTDMCWSPHYKELFLSAYSSLGDIGEGQMSHGELGADSTFGEDSRWITEEIYHLVFG